ncbi:hypothetical protein N657DRAFT_651261 [Parathielavia appendiculata]|uniref:Uncharacterized protein n=1 Tax=Parathielavia appendiculata TaxID=2587402 RepID=A0AAN6TPR4_9PEZI|nr:hypothetical protein N657DRAFT_651261 [Parathielavia appendiculata]
MKSFAALAALLALAAASPVELSPRDETSLEKRDTEILYLSNCRYLVSCCQPEAHSSHIFYYSASANSQNGNAPASNDQCAVTTDNYVWWEQDGRSCKFPTGVSVVTHIDADAASRPLYSWAGWASNGYKNFNCYRDNGRTLFTTSGPEWANTCSSVYYCVPQ